MKKTVLFVDDEEINLLVLKRVFGEFYDVLTANCGQEAIDVINQNLNSLSAIVSDLKMPDMSGIELFEKMNATISGIPCFLLTGYDNTVEIERALEKKLILKQFKKPFDTNEINSTLQQHF